VTPAEKLALAQSSYAAFSVGPDIEALIPLYHPACEWRLGYIGATLGSDVYHGHHGLREIIAAINESFESYAVAIDEAKITGEGILLLQFHIEARSRGYHLELSQQGWQEIESLDGLILRVIQRGKPPAAWSDATAIR